MLSSTLLDARLRKHITTHLNTRSSTLRTALDSYNKQATKLRRPQLTFEQVIEFDFLSIFDHLRDTRHNVRSKPWSETSNRLLRDSFYKRERAKEEIDRLNIEIKRLRSWMDTEVSHFERSIGATVPLNLDLAAELDRRLTRMRMKHRVIAHHLSKVESLRGYTGPVTVSVVGEDDDEWESDDENHHLDDVDRVLINMERHG